jgi:hypothetical protein
MPKVETESIIYILHFELNLKFKFSTSIPVYMPITVAAPSKA